MRKTTYQVPEIRDENNNIIQEGTFGRTTAFVTADNHGVLDYLFNNLEALHDIVIGAYLIFDSKDKFPTEGDAAKIYVSNADGKAYRWNGTEYAYMGTESTQFTALDIKKMKEEAENSASAAASSTTAAKTSEANSKASETAAKESETNAKTSETNAAKSQQDAASSAAAAKTSETNAKTSETNAETSNQTAKKWAESAESPDGATDSDSSTGKTQSSKSWALASKTSAESASSSANTATTQASSATASAKSASESATSASGSATSASSYASAASNSASAAATSATNASNSETQASEYKTAASNSATAAASSATSASTSATNAKADMNTANTAASSASTSATSASTSASNAAKAEVAAKTAQAEAEKARDDAASAVVKLTGVMKYAGQVDNYSDLADVTKNKGDVWNIVNADSAHGIKAGDNVAWNGTDWDDLSGTIDLSIYAEKTDYQKVITSATANGASITFNHKDGTTSTATVNNVASATAATNDAKGQKIDTTYEKIADASNVHTSLQNSINSLSTGKQDKLTFDSTPTANSSNPVTSDGIKAAIDAKTVDLSGYATTDSVSDAVNDISWGNGKLSVTTKGGTTTAVGIQYAGSCYKASMATSDGKGKNISDTYQTKLTFDTTPTADSTNPVTSSGIKTALDGKPSNTGDGASGTWGIDINGNASTATKATQDDWGHVIRTTYATKSELNNKQAKLTFDSTPTANSSNPVTSAGIKAAIDAKTVDLSNYYTKAQVDSAIAAGGKTVDLSNYYTKAQVDTAISTAISSIVDGDSKSY